MERAVSGEDGRVIIDLGSLQRVEVTLVAGDVLVAATPGPSRVEVECQGGPDVEVQEFDGVLVIRHPPDCWPRARSRPRAVVAVQCPPGTDVRTSAVSASTVVAGMAGQMSSASISGPVTLSYVGGDVRARTVSGPVEMEGVSGRLEVTTVSGPVGLAGGCLADLQVSSASGDLELDLEVLPSGSYRCSTVSGDVALRVPAEAGAEVQARSVSGRLEVGGQPAFRGARGWYARLGDVDAPDSPRIVLRTVSGRLTVVPRSAAPPPPPAPRPPPAAPRTPAPPSPVGTPS